MKEPVASETERTVTDIGATATKCAAMKLTVDAMK